MTSINVLETVISVQ